MNNEKLSPSIIFIIILLLALTIISSYLLLKINNMLRSDSVVADHYELAVIGAKEVSLDSNSEVDEVSVELNPIGDLTNYKVEFEEGKAYITVLSKKGCESKIPSGSEVTLEENDKTEITGFQTKVVYGYVKTFEQGNTGIFFLMSDGTIEYATVSDLLTKESPKVDNKLSGIKNVVNVFSAKENDNDVLVALTSDKGYVVLDSLVN